MGYNVGNDAFTVQWNDDKNINMDLLKEFMTYGQSEKKYPNYIKEKIGSRQPKIAIVFYFFSIFF